jgi:hypothetical protein
LNGPNLGQAPVVVGEKAIAVGIVWAAHRKLLKWYLQDKLLP